MQKWVRIASAFLIILGLVMVVALVTHNAGETANIVIPPWDPITVPVYLLIAVSMLLGAALPRTIRILFRIFRRKKADKKQQ